VNSKPKVPGFLLLVCGLAAGVGGIVVGETGGGEVEIHGAVIAENGPVAGAIVRVQTTTVSVVTSFRGEFSVPSVGLGSGPLPLTAWAEGFFCAGPVMATPGDRNVVIELVSYQVADHPDYRWLSAVSTEGEGEGQGCIVCHSRGSDLDYDLPVDEWLDDAHSRSAQNPRFLTMYLGTDLEGRTSPRTTIWVDEDYGDQPLPPDSASPYYGPGYKLDFPESTGSCGACHLPVAAADAPHDADPTSVVGVAAEGVTCDFCHKIRDVILDPSTGRPGHDRPGVLSIRLNRPSEGHQFFAGPFDDVAPGEDTYSQLQRDSRICAPCHFGSFWGTVIYNSFGEWLDSPYSNPDTGQTCQDCHMPATGNLYFARPDRGGRRRAGTPLPSHRMPGAADEKLLQNAVSMELSVERDDGSIIANVAITNDQTGHHVPTDSPLRHLILLVCARDSDGRSLDLVEGSVVPEWGGVGEPSAGYYSGLPGKAFAKILMEKWTKVVPTGAYWNHTSLISDNRIAAFGADTSSYRFSVGNHETVRVSAELIFRRAFKKLMDQKGWSDPDVIMETASVELEPENPPEAT
jgi:hypothetical protein